MTHWIRTFLWTLGLGGRWSLCHQTSLISYGSNPQPPSVRYGSHANQPHFHPCTHQDMAVITQWQGEETLAGETANGKCPESKGEVEGHSEEIYWWKECRAAWEGWSRVKVPKWGIRSSGRDWQVSDNWIKWGHAEHIRHCPGWESWGVDERRQAEPAMGTGARSLQWWLSKLKKEVKLSISCELDKEVRLWWAW